MKQILLSLLLFCSLSISAQDVVVTHQKKQQTTTTKPKQNSSKPTPAKKTNTTASKPSVTASKSETENKPTSGYVNGHKWVDLGLSVKWATCNVGASTPEDYGDYYAWGETETKSTYDESTYKWCNGSDDTMTKYCTDTFSGKVDNKTTLDPEDDVAHVKWGGDWRMPTKAEQYELLDNNNCTWKWTNQGGKNGYKVTSKKNGNSIFLPAAGYSFGGLSGAGSYGHYWSSSLDTSNSNYDSDRLYIYLGGVGCNGSIRYSGRSVRPVCP